MKKPIRIKSKGFDFESFEQDVLELQEKHKEELLELNLELRAQYIYKPQVGALRFAVEFKDEKFKPLMWDLMLKHNTI